MADNSTRRPGSQVAPNQKPFHRQGTTASTHSRVPLDQATAGKLYRVRDKADEKTGEAVVWAENLTHDAAVAYREKIVAARKSKTARVEEMPEPDADTITAVAEGEPLTEVVTPVVAPAGAAVAPITPTRVAAPAPTYGLDVSIDYSKIPDAELSRALGTDARRWARTFWQKASALGIKLSKGDEAFILFWFTAALEAKKIAAVQQLSDDPVLAEAQKKALAAARPVAAQAQQRAKKVVMSDPPKPPPSPLTDELLEGIEGEGELPPDEEGFDTSDISDISSEVGGAPSHADADRAKQAAEQTAEEQLAAAKEAYDLTVAASVDGPWPAWEQLGAFEHAAWRFFVAQGGAAPTLVKEPRKVEHAMGAVS